MVERRGMKGVEEVQEDEKAGDGYGRERNMSTKRRRGYRPRTLLG